jgi:hypothetical protein
LDDVVGEAAQGLGGGCRRLLAMSRLCGVDDGLPVQAANPFARSLEDAWGVLEDVAGILVL